MSISFLQGLVISTLLLLVPLCFYFRRSTSRSKLPTNWPILYMSPSLITNLHSLHGYLAVVLAGSGLSFRANPLPGIGMRFFFTCDPDNVRHIFTTNCPNYPKGPEFAAIFDIMDGAIFTIDGERWRRPRKKIQSVLSSPRLVAHMAACCRDMLKNNLISRFTEMASIEFDMQELMVRFMFDLTAMTVIGVDPGLMSLDMPPMDVSDAMDLVMEVGFVRHLMPAYCWKAMRWLNIGPERKLATAHAVLRRFVSEILEKRRKIDQSGHVGNNDEDKEGLYILSSYVTDPDYASDDLLRATLLEFMVAGRDTLGTSLTWIFYILSQRPDVMSIIRNELSPIASCKVAASTGDVVIFEPEETKPLVYLAAVLYETLRLYPPGPFLRKTVIDDDTMPSGHVVNAGDVIIVSFHSMGRMEEVWGKDCLEYNPDRWLSEDDVNKLRYVPPHKFSAFNSGPRICPGKDIAVMQMKTIVAAVVWNFDMEVVEGQTIQPKSSCLLQMKSGLKMKLKKRELQH